MDGESGNARGATATAPPPDAKQPAAAESIRPELAQGVKLAGQLQESAFKSPPWLLEREGAGYVQVTELLYRIAERCDGERTFEEIAADLAANGRPVRPDTVQRLVLQMLIPLGLVQAPDGSVQPVTAKRGALLALNMRMKMVGPKVTDPLTSVLRWLYWPGIQGLLLVAAVLTQVWLFAVHGIAASTRDAIYQPGLMLVVLAFTVISAGFHELGHAAALRYGGGTVKGMGAGLYLIYPAFYTDVSDNYRLRRWPRVRTDLGGFYFNLIFGLATLAVFAVTHQEFLLLLVLLSDFEILYQLQPFVRLDGYWTLADLTGIPDFFSEMGAFWRSILPIRRWKGQKLAELKWWGKLVFALYTLITLPLLAFVLFTMVRTVPRVLATTFDSARKLATGVAPAFARGDVLTVIANGVQILLLALPTIGMLLIVFTVVRTVFRMLWSWSKPSPARRVIGGLAMATIAGVLVFLWTPQLPHIGLGAGKPGPLYAASSFQPISPNDRGTIGEAANALPVFGSYFPSEPASVIATASATASHAPAGSVTGTVSPTATASVTPSATAQGSQTPAASQTPAIATSQAGVPQPNAGPQVATSQAGGVQPGSGFQVATSQAGGVQPGSGFQMATSQAGGVQPGSGLQVATAPVATAPISGTVVITQVPIPSATAIQTPVR